MNQNNLAAELLKSKKENFSIEIRRQSREQTLRKNRETLQIHNELNNNIFQLEDVKESVECYLNTSLPINERFRLIASSLQLTRNEDEVHRKVVIQLFLKDPRLLNQLKLDIYDENQSDQFRVHDLYPFKEQIMTMIVRLTQTSATITENLIEKKFHVLIHQVLIMAHAHGQTKFFDLALQGIANIAQEAREQLIAMKLDQTISGILNSTLTLQQAKSIASIINYITKDTIDSNQPLKEYTLIAFALYQKAAFMNNFEYASDVLYSLYSISVSIQVSEIENYKRDFVEFLIGCPNFKNYIIKYWYCNQYNVLIPSLRLFQILSKMKYHLDIIFQIVKEGFFDHQSKIFDHEFNLVRIDGIKVLVSLFTVYRGPEVKELSGQIMEKILRLAQINRQLTNPCLNLFTVEYEHQDFSLGPEIRGELFNFIYSVLRDDRYNEQISTALILLQVLMKSDQEGVQEWIYTSNMKAVLEKLLHYSKSSSVIEQSKRALDLYDRIYS